MNDSAGLTPDQLEALRQLCQAATPSKWEWYAGEQDNEPPVVYYAQAGGSAWVCQFYGRDDDETAYPDANANAAFIAAARTAVPALLEQLASVTAERDALRQQAERLTTALRHIAEWKHGNGCEVGKYGWVYECSCAGPGMWQIARDALAQEDVSDG